MILQIASPPEMVRRKVGIIIHGREVSNVLRYVLTLSLSSVRTLKIDSQVSRHNHSL